MYHSTQSKKRIAILLAAALLIALLPQLTLPASAAPAASGTCGLCLQWTFDPVKGILTITGSGRMTEWNAETEVPWQSFSRMITSVRLPKELTSIGSFAFSSFNALQEISLPEGLTEIGPYAFYGCRELSELLLPQSLRSIENLAFAECFSLQKVTFLGAAPALGSGVFSVWSDSYNDYINISGLTLNYLDGQQGWTTPSWKGYPAAPLSGDGHRHSYGITTVPPTCTEEGKNVFTCRICGQSFEQLLPALGHEFDEYGICNRCCYGAPSVACMHDQWFVLVNTPATCTLPGEWYRVCLRCGEEEHVITEPLGHRDFNDDGLCDFCTYFDPDAPENSEYRRTEEFFDGDRVIIYNTAYRVAVRDEQAGERYLAAQSISAQGNSIFTSEEAVIWTVIENPDGSFSFANGDDLLAAYKTENGIRLTNDAAKPGAETRWILHWDDGLCYLQSATVSDSRGFAYLECWPQTYEDIEYISAYSSDDPSSRSYAFGFCFFARRSYQQHTWVKGKSEAATCTQPGYSIYYCPICGAVEKMITEEAPGHSFETVTTQPTCTEAGSTVKTCTCCGQTETQMIHALGHDLMIFPAVAPSCTQPGLTEGARCRRPHCGYEVPQTVRYALGHNYVDGYCTRCEAASPEIIIPKDPCEGYTDIDRNAWYHIAADLMLKLGIMGSTSTDRLIFEPGTVCTRSMIVTILYRLTGCPTTAYAPVFPDVRDGQWYTAPILWAYQNGVVTGYDNGAFGTNDPITREQLAVILRSFSKNVLKGNTSWSVSLEDYPDAEKVTWSKEAMSWAVAVGLFSGKAVNGELLLDPQGKATRAEVAAVFMSFLPKSVRSVH